MNRFQYNLLLLTSLVVAASCQNNQPPKAAPQAIKPDTPDTASVATKVKLHTDSTWARNLRLVTDTILPQYKQLVTYYFRKYRRDTCGANEMDSTSFEYYDGVGRVGRIRLDRPATAVFVLPPLDYCHEGQSYYFTDTTLPRLETESYCCHPGSLFTVGDIDEDGIAEIGQYYSSCASHYKSLYVYSLKNGQWKEIGHSVFDLHYMDAEHGYRQFVRKTGKGRFEMLQVTDLTDRDKIGKKDWLKCSL